VTGLEYDYKAKKTRVEHSVGGLEGRVIEYDSRREGGLGMLLDREGIGFTPHEEYDVIDRDGEGHVYEVDFDLHRPHKLKGISHPVSFLEYKGVFKQRDKAKALRYFVDSTDGALSYAGFRRKRYGWKFQRLPTCPRTDSSNVKLVHKRMPMTAEDILKTHSREVPSP